MLSRRRSPARADIEAVPVGVTATGAPFTVPLARVSTLIAGLPGAGKSSTLAAVIAGSAGLDDLAIIILDPKRVQFSHTVARCMVARGVDNCTTALDALTALMDHRYGYLEANGLDEWPRRWGRVLVIVDELAELMATGDRKADTARTVALRRLLQLGRAAGVTVVAATQRPSASLIDSDARALFGARIAHALDGPESIRMAGLDPDLAPAHRLPLGAQHAGLAYAQTDGTRTPIKVRTWWTSPAELERICTRNRHRYVDPFGPSRGLALPDTLSGPVHQLEQPSEDNDRREASALREEPPAPSTPRARVEPTPLTPAVPVASADTSPGATGAVLAVLDRRGSTTAQLTVAVGLPRDDVARACETLAAAGTITRGRDNRWRTAA